MARDVEPRVGMLVRLSTRSWKERNVWCSERGSDRRGTLGRNDVAMIIGAPRAKNNDGTNPEVMIMCRTCIGWMSFYVFDVIDDDEGEDEEGC